MLAFPLLNLRGSTASYPELFHHSPISISIPTCISEEEEGNGRGVLWMGPYGLI